MILVASDEYVAPRFHMFYGFVAFITVGIAYCYRQQMRGRRELFYGLVGLFIMGLGIRAVLQVADVTRGSAGSAGRRLRVLLLFGGRSAEHDVSRVTAVAVAAALDPSGTRWCRSPSPPRASWLFADAARRDVERAAEVRPRRIRRRASTSTARPARRCSATLGRDRWRLGAAGALDVDVVLPLLHGPYGEDGTVQGLLELAGLPYVGSGVVGSAVGMDKIMMKRAFAACGLADAALPVELRDGHDVGPFAGRVEAELGYPCFVKPANMGSSVGVSKAARPGRLARRVRAWRSTTTSGSSSRRPSSGREIEVAVLGDDPPEASVPGEIVPGDEFYSYADKYETDEAELLVPAPLTADEVAEVQRARGRGVRGVPVRGDGAGRLLPRRRPTARLPGQRGQHDPGLHADLDVPAAVGGVGRAVPGAARPAHRARVRPPRAPRRPRRPPALRARRRARG